MTGWEKRTIDAAGVHTSFLEAGDPRAPALVLIHDGGYGADAHASWDPVRDHFADSYHVLAPDMLGHGGTDKIYYFDRSPHEQRIRHLADFCDAVIDGRPAHYVGSSYGGSLVVRAAASETWPMLSGTSICGTAGLFKVASRHEALRGFEPTREWTEDLVGALVKDPRAHDGLIERRFENAQIPGHWETMSATRLASPFPRTQSPDDLEARLLSCSVPLLFIAGRDDPLLTPGWESALAGLTPAGRTTELEGRHCPQLDDPDGVARAVRAFHEELGSERAPC
jgi:pimeloyl-ACP methyl ester carboxylesterase